MPQKLVVGRYFEFADLLIECESTVKRVVCENQRHSING